MKVRVNCIFKYTYVADVRDDVKDFFIEVDSADPVFDKIVKLMEKAGIKEFESELDYIEDQNGNMIFG